MDILTYSIFNLNAYLYPVGLNLLIYSQYNDIYYSECIADYRRSSKYSPY